MLRCTLPVSLRLLCLFVAGQVWCFGDVGSIFISGHDPDFWAQTDIGAAHGAANFLQVGMDFADNGRAGKFLLVGGSPGCLTNACAAAGHLNPVVTLNEMGFATGTAFDIAASASDIAAADLSSYSFIM